MDDDGVAFTKDGVALGLLFAIVAFGVFVFDFELILGRVVAAADAKLRLVGGKSCVGAKANGNVELLPTVVAALVNLFMLNSRPHNLARTTFIFTLSESFSDRSEVTKSKS